jgi:hypothetical protein
LWHIPKSSFFRPSIFGRGVLPGEPAENGVAGLSRERRVIVKEKPKDIAGRIEPLDRFM